MMDRTCADCERQLLAYEQAVHCQRLIEHKSAIEAGLELVLRKATNRCELARQAVEDHESMHMSAAEVGEGDRSWTLASSASSTGSTRISAKTPFTV